MESIELIGFVAGGLVSISFFPQVVKSWRTKSTKDISIFLSILNLSGQIMWITYGFRIQSLSLIVMSCVSVVMMSTLFLLKVRYG